MQKIRVWKLGSLEHMIMPTEESYKKIEEILTSISNMDGTFDIIWGASTRGF